MKTLKCFLYFVGGLLLAGLLYFCARIFAEWARGLVMEVIK